MLLGPLSGWGPWCGMQSLLGMHSGTGTKGDTTALWGTPTGLTARIFSGVAALGGRRFRLWRLGFRSGSGTVTGLIRVPKGSNAGIILRLCGGVQEELDALELIVLVGGVCSWFVAMILLGTILEKSLINWMLFWEIAFYPFTEFVVCSHYYYYIDNIISTSPEDEYMHAWLYQLPLGWFLSSWSCILFSAKNSKIWAGTITNNPCILAAWMTRTTCTDCKVTERLLHIYSIDQYSHAWPHINHFPLHDIMIIYLVYFIQGFDAL